MTSSGAISTDRTASTVRTVKDRLPWRSHLPSSWKRRQAKTSVWSHIDQRIVRLWRTVCHGISVCLGGVISLPPCHFSHFYISCIAFLFFFTMWLKRAFLWIKTVPNCSRQNECLEPYWSTDRAAMKDRLPWRSHLPSSRNQRQANRGLCGLEHRAEE